MATEPERTWEDDEDFIDRILDAHDRSATTVRNALLGFGVPEEYAWKFTSRITVYGQRGARSPLEELFATAIAGPAFLRGVTVYHEPDDYAPYKPDFELYRFGHVGPDYEETLIVELDGHQFHEKTPEQAEHDRKRDRWFAARGLRVIRFTGREVWRDATACATEALSFFAPLADEPTEQ